MAQNFNVEEPPDANNIDVPENDRLSSAVGQKCFRWLIIGENGREEEDLWKKGFSKISSEVEIEYETSLSSLITAYQEDSVEIEFDLIIIEMDFSAVATVERRCKMALILRLLNYSAPILGLISNADSDQDDMDENKMQELSQHSFNTTFPKPLTADMADSIVLYYCANEKKKKPNMFDSSNGSGLRSLLSTVISDSNGTPRTSNGVSPSSVGDTDGNVTGTSTPQNPSEQNASIGKQEPTPNAPTLAQDAKLTSVPKILIVEDSQMTLKLYKRMWTFALSKFSIDVDVSIDVARDGDEAVELVKAGNEYLVIMMDIEMPRVGGIDAAKLLRLLQVQSCIIACSSHTLEEVASDTFRGDILLSTIDHFIHKPLTRDSALEITARYILPKLKDIPAFKPMSTIVKLFKSDSPVGAEERHVSQSSPSPSTTQTPPGPPLIPGSVIRGLL
eukprot:CAMPEP_0118646444 /NCGR_PEP_ID=MMETSP0785-20121206/8058_1 /TAXON_ID=91992 /ORGANISM="Bolidomonas pacifica, Strain CCMP 1866" /LENGTH=446 /DNA_ID=CAMNT_0006538435 /DNA_START=153 /DNA_END=1490 /DNA_ORIENTATION=+